MIIRTVKQHGDFAILPKQALNDERLSWEARGVLAYLLEKPDGWQVYQSDLVKRGTAKDYKVRRIMAELEDSGYVVRRRINGNGGTFDWITEIYETPQQVVSPSINNHHMVGSPSRGFPRVDKPRVGKPRVGKPRVGNREISKQQQNLGLTESIPDSSEQQQQQDASPAEPDPVSGHAAAAVLEVRKELQDFGVAGRIVEELSTRPLDHVQGWIAYAGTQDGLTNPIGFVVKQLRGRVAPPPIPEEEDEDSYEALKRRYVPSGYEDIIEH